MKTERRKKFARTARTTAADTLKPQNDPVTFVVTQNVLVTLRYADPQPFRNFIANLRRYTLSCSCGEDVMAAIFDAIVARVADILEKVNSETDEISGQIFHRDRISRPDYDGVLRRIGRNRTVLSGKSFAFARKHCLRFVL